MLVNTELEICTVENFRESNYLAANKDVAEAVRSGGFASGFDHFQQYGHLESRNQFITWLGSGIMQGPTTRKIFAEAITQRENKNILEIGPLSRPLVTSDNCWYFDICDTETLKAKARDAGLNEDTIPEIDFVDKHGDLSSVDMKFDSIVSAHCIEHQPDLIRHLNQVSFLLKNVGSRYWVIVPDKRFCFDHFIPESHVIEVVNANVEEQRTPTKTDVLQHFAMTTHNDPSRHWVGDHGEIKSDLFSRLAAAERKYEDANGEYIDVHCWQFTPESFFKIIGGLYERSYIDFKCTKIFETDRNQSEFFAILEKVR